MAYELFWHNKFNPDELIKTRKGRRSSDDADLTIMPKLMQDLSTCQGFFDPRSQWESKKQSTRTVGHHDSQWRREFDDLLAEAEGKIKDSTKLTKLWQDSAHATTPARQQDLTRRLARLVKEGESSSSAKIREKAENKRQSTKEDDEDRLLNATLSKMRKNTLSALLDVKPHMTTQYGRLRWMLEVLACSIEREHHVMALDCLFALREFPLFKALRKHHQDDTKAARLYRKFDKVIRDAIDVLGDIDDLILYQMTYMKDCMPPLSRFSFEKSLDEWQKRVLSLIDENQSVLVSAPTSAGKTVLSTYVTLKAQKIMFVVPTEALVWQIAAMFYQVLGSDVALATNSLVYSPRRQQPQDWKCIVGTPLALESALLKPRGRIGKEYNGQQDYRVFRGHFHEIEYAVYDEVHTLDGEEGAALERLIKSVRCNFLALSATIGNATALCEWWQAIHDAHVADECADIRSLIDQGQDVEAWTRLKRYHEMGLVVVKNMTEVEKNWKTALPHLTFHPVTPHRVHLVQHTVRFLNLQRWVWTGESLDMLHPLSAGVTTLDYTPSDCWRLWTSLMPYTRLDIDTLLGGKRITLDMVRTFEHALKEELTRLPSDVLDRVLGTFRYTKTVPSAISESCHVWEMIKTLHTRRMLPCLCFRLDTVECISTFERLIHAIEHEERTTFPTYYEELTQKRQEREALLERVNTLVDRQSKAPRRKTRGRDDDQHDDIDHADLLCDIGAPVDDTQPHPNFVLHAMSREEFLDIVEPIFTYDGLDETHPYIRALRRGIGIYVDDPHLEEYPRTIQRLAQQGRLGVVFSDACLAYGVNMPFRTVVFCGDDPDVLDPLMATQMSGRAGRRGLDTQGNIVFAFMPLERIQTLLAGVLPAIHGHETYYDALVLSHTLQHHWHTIYGDPADRIRYFPLSMTLTRLATTSATPFCHGGTIHGGYDAIDASLRALVAANILNNDMSFCVSPGVAALLWELRLYGNQMSFAIVTRIPSLFDATRDSLEKEMRGLDVKSWQKVKMEYLEADLLVMLLSIVDRQPVTPDRGSLADDASFIASRRMELIQRIGTDVDFDPLMYRILVQRLPKSAFTGVSWFHVRRRMWTIGTIVMKMHNCLSMPHDATFEKMVILLRKTFRRIQWTMRDFFKTSTV